MTASTGIVNVARLARVPIVPITYATSRRRVLATWDRFHLPWPFGRGVYLWGEPIEIAGASMTRGSNRPVACVETRMVEMVREADRRVGRGMPPPLIAADAARPATPGRGRVMLPLLYRSLDPAAWRRWRRPTWRSGAGAARSTRSAFPSAGAFSQRAPAGVRWRGFMPRASAKRRRCWR